MSRDSKHEDHALTPEEEKKAQSAASAAGRAHPDATDRRTVVEESESEKDQPKNSGNPHPTGSQAEKKNHSGPKEH